jgi:hypothetical protein
MGIESYYVLRAGKGCPDFPQMRWRNSWKRIVWKDPKIGEPLQGPTSRWGRNTKPARIKDLGKI